MWAGCRLTHCRSYRWRTLVQPWILSTRWLDWLTSLCRRLHTLKTASYSAHHRAANKRSPRKAGLLMYGVTTADLRSSVFSGFKCWRHFVGMAEVCVETGGPQLSVTDRQWWCHWVWRTLTWTEEGGWCLWLSQLRCLPVQMDRGWVWVSVWERGELGTVQIWSRASVLNHLWRFVYASEERSHHCFLKITGLSQEMVPFV